jgi:hypothetical protein
VRGLGSLVGLVLVLGIGYWIYSAQLAGTSHEEPVRRRIDIVGVRADLLAFAQAERFHMAARGSYTTLEQLRESATVSNLPASPRPGYSYQVEIDGSSHFLITARPEGTRPDLPTLSIDETLTIRQ